MRPAPIPDDQVWDGANRIVIAPPNGDLTDPDIAPVEAVVDATEAGPRISVRCVPEPGDLEKLQRGGAVWITFYGRQIMPFATTVTGPDGT